MAAGGDEIAPEQVTERRAQHRDRQEPPARIGLPAPERQHEDDRDDQAHVERGVREQHDLLRQRFPGRLDVGHQQLAYDRAHGAGGDQRVEPGRRRDAPALGTHQARQAAEHQQVEREPERVRDRGVWRRGLVLVERRPDDEAGTPARHGGREERPCVPFAAPGGGACRARQRGAESQDSDGPPGTRVQAQPRAAPDEQDGIARAAEGEAGEQRADPTWGARIQVANGWHWGLLRANRRPTRNLECVRLPGMTFLAGLRLLLLLPLRGE